MKNNHTSALFKDASAILNRLAETVIGIKLSETRQKLWALNIAVAIFGLLLVATSVFVFADLTVFTTVLVFLIGCLGGVAYFKANSEANEAFQLKVQFVQEYFTVYEILFPNKGIPSDLIYELSDKKPVQGETYFCSPQTIQGYILTKAEEGDIKSFNKYVNVLMKNKDKFSDYEIHQPVSIDAN